jgi:hypothetical protein
MKPSEIIGKAQFEYSRDSAMFKILDGIAEDVQQIKAVIRTMDSKSLPYLTIKNIFQDREWEKEDQDARTD